MSQYVCSICGYVFDEAVGMPEANIKPGTKWEDIPEDFVCPLCGAPKSAFVKKEDGVKIEKKVEVKKEETNQESDYKELSYPELSAVCYNLAKGCQKQYKEEEESLFNELGDYFSSLSPEVNGDYQDLLNLVNQNINEEMVKAKEEAVSVSDRGALRALTWSDKVSRILKSILENYQKNGKDILNRKKVFVCEICGFIYIGDKAPDVCPVCKVPSLKIHEVL